jgi:methyl coenzyme M reductase subunit C-like uncharacterized protein (methanogenesis marker protein 7)
MAVSKAEVEAAREAADNLRDSTLPEIETREELLAYAVALARHHGPDEADAIELVLRAAGTSAESMRSSERIMRKLGYSRVADRLAVMIAELA